MSTTTDDLYVEFMRAIKRGNWTRNNVTLAEKRGQIVRRDVAQVYEAVFLQAVVSFELFVEELFLNLLSNSVTHPRPCRPRVVFPSPDLARTIIGNGKYIDWLPLDRLLERSKLFFDELANPFVCLNHAQREEVRKALLIRNLIAHKSPHAVAAYQRHVLAGVMLPPRRRDLLGYLQYPHAGAVTKYEYHIGEISRVAHVLSH